MTIYTDANVTILGTPIEKDTATSGKIIVGRGATKQGDIEFVIFGSKSTSEEARRAREALKHRALSECFDGDVAHIVGTLTLDEYESQVTGDTIQTLRMALFGMGEPKEELGDNIVARVTGCRFDEKEVEHGEIDGVPAACLTFSSDCGPIKGSTARRTVTVVEGQELLDKLEAAANWDWIDVHGNLEVPTDDDGMYLCIRVGKLVEGTDPTVKVENRAAGSPSASAVKRQFMSNGSRKAAPVSDLASVKAASKDFDDKVPF